MFFRAVLGFGGVGSRWVVVVLFGTVRGAVLVGYGYGYGYGCGCLYDITE